MQESWPVKVESMLQTVNLIDQTSAALNELWSSESKSFSRYTLLPAIGNRLRMGFWKGSAKGSEWVSSLYFEWKTRYGVYQPSFLQTEFWYKALTYANRNLQSHREKNVCLYKEQPHFFRRKSPQLNLITNNTKNSKLCHNREQCIELTNISPEEQDCQQHTGW